MLLNQIIKDNLNLKKDWAKQYYDIADIDDRERVLRELISLSDNYESFQESVDPKNIDGFASEDEYRQFFSDNERRLEILLKRYPEAIINQTRADRFAMAWLNLLTDSRMGINFLNRNRVRKDVTRCLRDLLVIDFVADDILCQEWAQFAEFWIKSCTRDTTYDSTAFGLLRLNDKRLGSKIASEIIDVTFTLPEKFGYTEECAPLRNIFRQTFLKMIDHGDIYWSEAVSDKNDLL